MEITAVGRAIAYRIRAHSALHHDGARGAAGFRERRAGRGKTSSPHHRTTSRRDERNIILSDMHVVIADQLSSSAIEILRTVPGFTVDARPQRPAAELAKDLADADALIVRSATQVDAKLIAACPCAAENVSAPNTFVEFSVT